MITKDQPIGSTNNAGATVTFTAAVTGTSPLTYQWVQNGTNTLTDGGNISGSSTPNLTIGDVLGGNSGQYTLIVHSGAGATTSVPAELLVVDPLITNQPVSVVQPSGTQVQFSVGAYGTTPAYQWLKNGLPISGGTEATLTIAQASVADAAAFSVIVSNVFGSVTSSVATLNVIGIPSGDTNYAQLSFTAPVVGLSQTGSVALSLYASAGVTQLTFALDAPADAVSSMTVRSLVSGILVAGQSTPGAAQTLVTVIGINGQALPTQQPLIEVDFQTATNQPSSMGLLTASAVTALQANGLPLPNGLGAQTKLVFVNQQSLIEAQVLPGGGRSLALYAPPGNSYVIESSSSPTGATGWMYLLTTAPTNSPVQILENIDASNAMMFYRARSL